MRQKILDDLALGGFRVVRTAATATRILHCKMKRRGAGFVLQRGIAPGFQQESHGLGATGANSAVQGRGAIFVLGIDSGPGIEETTESVNLFPGAPCRAAQARIRSIVQRATMPMICGGVRIGPCGEQQFNDINAITGGGQMQRRVSDINPMKNFSLVQSGFAGLKGGERWICVQ